MKKKSLAALVLACIMLMGTASAAWSPVDFAGGSLSGIVSDGKSVLVSDVFNKVVWRITGDEVEQAVGQISVPGLNGEPIGKYDDGTLDTALFMEPWAMTPFLDGYAITDSEAHVVRYFDERGVFTAVGSGKAGFRNGTGTGATFDNPTGLATGDDGEVYIADTGNGCIRVMTEKGKVTTWASGLSSPTGLCWFDGDLYVAETGKSRILRIDGDDKDYTVIAGGEEGYADGSAATARFCNPQGVAVGEDGTVYVADTENHAVRRVKDGVVTTLAVSRETPEAPVQPRGILVQNDRLLVTDLFAQTVLEIDLSPVSYADIPADYWAESYITAATERNILESTGGNCFSPNAPVTRAAFAVMLSRIHQYVDGSAVINGESTFSDVPADASYAAAVRWAADLGVIQGNNGLFNPNQVVTRQQLVAMFYRYAQVMGYDTSAGEDTNILSYTDALSVSEYAVAALQWACGEGIVSGYADGSLRPHGQATRAHMSKILITAMNAFGI